MLVRLVGLEDMEGVKVILRKYHRDTNSDEDRPDGFVTTAITDEQLAELIGKEHGVTIIAEPAEEGPDKVLGFCFAAPWELTRMAELYIENYMEQDFLESIPTDEPIVIDCTILSDEDMKELIKCAAASMELESDDNSSSLLLS